jgi:hypothetical protein
MTSGTSSPTSRSGIVARIGVRRRVTANWRASVRTAKRPAPPGGRPLQSRRREATHPQSVRTGESHREAQGGLFSRGTSVLRNNGEGKSYARQPFASSSQHQTERRHPSRGNPGVYGGCRLDDLEHQPVNHSGKHDHGQCILPEGQPGVAVNQEIQHARAAAPRTIESGQFVELARREPGCGPRLQKTHNRDQTRQDQRSAVNQAAIPRQSHRGCFSRSV